MGWIRLRAAAGLALAQLRHRPARTALATAGVALAVVSTVLLAGLGVSVLTAGEAGIEGVGGELWATGGAVTFAPGEVGSVETQLFDAHETTREIEAHDDVRAARAMHFQTVYVGTGSSEYDTVVGVGVTGDGAPFDAEAGETFSGGDDHYAGGSYDGPMSGEVLVDTRTADQLGVDVGDELHVGGTIASAREHTFTVVGISDDVGGYLGAPTVTLHLAELQQVSGSTHTDPASTIVIALESDTNPEVVREDLEATHPELTVRTNEEQFRAVLGRQSVLVATAVALFTFAVGGGIALVANALGTFVYQQRRQLAALRAIGVSRRTLLGAVLAQGVVVVGLGGAAGLALSMPGLEAINLTVEYATGFEDVVTAPRWLFALGAGVALSVGILGAVAVGWLVVRLSALSQLRS